MFKKLRNRIIITTMATTTAVLILAGTIIMLFSSTMRPEPEPPRNGITISFNEPSFNDQAFNDYIKTDREEGNTRLLITLICVGLLIEIGTFCIVYYLSQKIVEPVKDTYDKQKLFIANASHELKTPLAVIEANIEALDVSKANEKWKRNIEHEITHANKLVLDLLQLARMDAGNNKSTPEKFDLNKEIKNHIELFKPKFSGTITYKSNTKSKSFLLPKQDILQVLDILLDNATKYGHKKITVVLNNNSIKVTNDGTTIPKKDLNKIFDRFYQTDKTKDGSGLGLAIASALCAQNNWQIKADSNARTTTFTVTF